MPVNVTRKGRVRSRSCSTQGDNLPVKEPRSWIIRDETDSHVVSSTAAYGHDIAPDRIHEICHVATRNPHNIEMVLEKNHELEAEDAEWTTYAVQMYRVLKERTKGQHGTTSCKYGTYGSTGS